MRERITRLPEGFVGNVAIDLSAIAIGVGFIIEAHAGSLDLLGGTGVGAAMLIAGAYGLYAEAKEVVRVNRRNSMVPPNAFTHQQ